MELPEISKLSTSAAAAVATTISYYILIFIAFGSYREGFLSFPTNSIKATYNKWFRHV